MKLSFTLSLLSFLCANAAIEEELVDETFDSRTKEHKIAFILFYIPRSEEYREMYSTYREVTALLDKDNSRIPLVRVNCSAAACEETCLRFRANENVMLMVFCHGEYSETYKGSKVSTGIYNFLKSYMAPASKELTTIDCLRDFLEAERETALVGLFEKNSDMEIAFFDVAEKYKNRVRYAHASAKDIQEALETHNGIMLFRPLHLHNKYEPTILEYTGPADSLSIKEFIDGNWHGLVGIRTKKNAENFAYPMIIVYFDIDYENFPQTTQYWRNKIVRVANKYQNNATFVMSNAEDFEEELMNYDLDFLDKPLVVAKDGETNKYVLEGEFSVHRLENFVEDFLRGTMKPYFARSEPLPINNNGSVKIVVAENFKTLVIDSEKDVLIGFYSKWCTPCKKMTSGYLQLANKFKEEDVVFAAMDAFKNDLPEEYKVQELYTPTVYWVPIRSKLSPMRYRGELREEDLIKFIAKYATYELKGYDRRGNLKKHSKTEL